MRRTLALSLIVLVLAAACTSGGGTSLSTPDNSAVNTLGGALEWDHSADVAIVRLDTTGTSGDPANDLNVLPFCLLYGDGHVIWTDPFADPEQVLEDRVSEQAVRGFLEFVIGTGFYSWNAEEGILIPATEEPTEGPILERISVTLYGETHVINALSNWPPDAYGNIMERCQQLSNTPVLYVPDGAWVSAIPAPLRSDVPSMPWDTFRESYPEITLDTMTLDAPLWATGDFVQTAWDIARRGRMQITENGAAYRIVVQVPGLQPFAPPAPVAGPES